MHPSITEFNHFRDIIYSITPLFAQLMLIENLLCARSWEYLSEPNKCPFPYGIYVLVREINHVITARNILFTIVTHANNKV